MGTATREPLDSYIVGEKGFVHLGAVVDDHGTWEDPSHYFASEEYVGFDALSRPCDPLLAMLGNENSRQLRGFGNADVSDG